MNKPNLYKSTNYLCLSFLMLVMADTALGAEYFVVSGPMKNFEDRIKGKTYSGYSFSATVTFDQFSPEIDIVKDSAINRVFYFNSVQSFEYAIYDDEGEFVLGDTLAGTFPDEANYTQVADDVEISTYIDRLTWSQGGTDETFSTTSWIEFLDMTGDSVESLAYPRPPEIGDFARSEFFFVKANKIFRTILFIGTGEITMISPSDPFLDCRNQAENRGQLMVCANTLIRALRDAGSISGKETGELHHQAAQNQ